MVQMGAVAVTKGSLRVCGIQWLSVCTLKSDLARFSNQQ